MNLTSGKMVPFMMVTGAMILPQPAKAFSVGTGVTNPCHERLAMAAMTQAQLIAPVDAIPDPPKGAWESLFDALFEALAYESQGPRQDFFFFSVLAGARANDTDGHSVFNLKALRLLHVDPTAQYAHFLRGQEDDYEEGNISALEGGKKQLLNFIGQMVEALEAPVDDQVIRVPFSVDFHGEIKVAVWGPAFFLGQALHTMQDSFSHTIRTDDMMRIIHVLNYADAVSGKWDEERDGLRHSDALDACSEDMGPVLDGTLQASVDLVFATTGILEQEATDMLAVEVAMEKWLQYEPGCDMHNNYCDSKWAKLAKEKPTLPYMDNATGCRATGFGTQFAIVTAPVLIRLCAKGRRRKAAVRS